MNGRLLVRPAPTLAGLIEMRGSGIQKVEFDPLAVAGWIVDLAATDVARLPDVPAQTAAIEGVTLPRLAVAAGEEPLPAVLAFLRTAPSLGPKRPGLPLKVGKK